MTLSQKSIVWKLANVPIPPKLSMQKLRWLENRLLGITHDFGTERKTTTSYEPQFRQLLHNFYHSTDEKTIDKEVICRLIVPTLQEHKTYLSIGAGEGKLSANVLSMGQFKEAFLVERNNDILPVLNKFFSMNFKNKRPTIIHEMLQTIAVSQGFEFGKPRMKYQIIEAEFPYGYNSREFTYEKINETFSSAPLLLSELIDPYVQLKTNAFFDENGGIPAYFMSDDQFFGRDPQLGRATLMGPGFFNLKRTEKGVTIYSPVKFPQADLVTLDHMLYFVKYEPGSHSEWINVAKQAYSLVNPGGALVILVHGDNVYHTPNEVASIITALDGKNDSINTFAMRLQSELSEARFEFIAAPTRHWAYSKESMKHILKFFMMDSNAPTGPAADEAMYAYMDQHLYQVRECTYECVKADKFIVAYKDKTWENSPFEYGQFHLETNHAYI